MTTRFCVALVVVLFLTDANYAEACRLYRNAGETKDPAWLMNTVDFVFHGRLASVERGAVSSDEYAEWLGKFGQSRAEILKYDRETTLTLVFEVDRVWKGQVGTPFKTQLITSLLCTSIPSAKAGVNYIVFGRHGHDVNLIHTFLSDEQLASAEPALDRGH